MKIYRFLSIGILAISCAMPALGSTGGMSYRDYRAAQDENSRQMPEFTSRGALTGAGQMRRLGQRLENETAQRVQGTILAGNSLPTQANREQWVREFVTTYESPYVMSELTQAAKEKYIEVISEFFKNAKLETAEATSADIEALYDKLSDRLQTAAAERLAPYLSTLAVQESRALKTTTQNLKSFVEQGKKIEQKLESTTLTEEQRLALEEQKKANNDKITASVATGWSLASKFIGGAVVAQVVGSLGYASIKAYQGEVKNLSEFASVALNAGPDLAKYGYNLLPEMKSLTSSSLVQEAQGLWNRMPSLWGKTAPERVGEEVFFGTRDQEVPMARSAKYWAERADSLAPEAENSDLVDASGMISQAGQAWKRSTASPRSEGIVNPELMVEPGQVSSPVVSDALRQAGQGAVKYVQEYGPVLDEDGNLVNPSVSGSELAAGAANSLSQLGQNWKKASSGPNIQEGFGEGKGYLFNEAPEVQTAVEQNSARSIDSASGAAEL